MRFNAAVLSEVGAALQVAEVDAAPLASNDVLVRVGASGLCHTDLEVISGALRRPLPIVLGHEGAGRVEAVGSDVSTLRPGDHVICSWNPSCGDCFYCNRGLPILCEVVSRHHPKGALLDGTSRLTLEGRALHHFSMVSSHAEYCVVPEQGAIRISRDIAFDCACLIGCGVMTGFGAAVHVARVTEGSEVVVVGCGSVGLNVIQGARASGAARIIAIDSNDARLELARVLGATDLVDNGEVDALESVRTMTSGRGAEFVFEAAGNGEAMALALECTRPGGQLVILGKIPVDERIAFRFGALMNEKRIVRSSYGGARPSRDFPALVAAYLEGSLRLDELIGMRLPLASINEGFDAMRSGRPGRNVVCFPI